MTKPPLAKVILYIDEETREFFGVRVESVWARHIDGDQYKIDNTPFFTFQVRTHDIVELMPHTDDQIDQENQGYPVLAIKQIIKRSGHETAHILALKPPDKECPIEEDPSFAPFEELFEYIRSSPFMFEGNNTSYCYMAAIDIPPNTDRTELHNRLKQGKANKHWVYTISDEPGAMLTP